MLSAYQLRGPAHLSLGFLGLSKVSLVHIYIQSLGAQRMGFPNFTLKDRVRWRGGMSGTSGVPRTIHSPLHKGVQFVEIHCTLRVYTVLICDASITNPLTAKRHTATLKTIQKMAKKHITHNTTILTPLHFCVLHSRFCAYAFLFLCRPFCILLFPLNIMIQHFPTSQFQ